MSEGPLRVVEYGSVDFLVLNSPRNRNALSIQSMQQLIAAIKRSAEKGSRALVIDHTGDVFCSGVDIKERLLQQDHPEEHSALLRDLFATLYSYEAPILCRVDGKVRGGGLGLLACCDVVVCSPRSDFAFSEVLVGVAPALVATAMLPRLSGRLLQRWMLSGATFDAGEAFRVGLVSRIATDAKSSIEGDLSNMLRGSLQSQKITKDLIRRLVGGSSAEALTEMETLSAELFSTEDAAEGMSAFREHRQPSWALSSAKAFAFGEADRIRG